VGRETLDHLVGVVHFRDLLASRGELLGALARQPPIVPTTKDLGALLRELRERRQAMAVVVDEYGSTAGIVTVHDVLEEIVGEIERIDETTVGVSGSMTIDDFNEAMGTQLPQEGPRTLAGLVFDALGRRPRPGDVAEFGDVTLRIETVEGLRITKLRVSL
jgi:putative hemolysin